MKGGYLDFAERLPLCQPSEAPPARILIPLDIPAYSFLIASKSLRVICSGMIRDHGLNAPMA